MKCFHHQNVVGANEHFLLKKAASFEKSCDLPNFYGQGAPNLNICFVLRSSMVVFPSSFCVTKRRGNASMVLKKELSTLLQPTNMIWEQIHLIQGRDLDKYFFDH